MHTYHLCDFRRGKYWHTYQSMESTLSAISRYILIDPDNNDTYSEELADFLLSMGTAIDTFFRNMRNCPRLKKKVYIPPWLKEGIRPLKNSYPKRPNLLVFNTETESRETGDPYLLTMYDGVKPIYLLVTRKLNFHFY